MEFLHLIGRGVDKRNVVLDDKDRVRFIHNLYVFNDLNPTPNFILPGRHESTRRRDLLVDIHAFCLMSNHYHLLVTERVEGGITTFFRRLNIGYAKYFNEKYHRVGGLFQGTFKAVQVDTDEYLQNLLVYVNVINPGELIEPNLKEEGVKDVERIMQFAESYSWSTHLEYLGERDSPIIDKGVAHSLFADPAKYKDFVENALTTRKINTIEHLMLE